MSQGSARRVAFALSGGSGPELTADKRDVTMVFSHLTDPAIGGCVPNSPAPVFGCSTLNKFNDSLLTSIIDWNPEDQLIFYFSGHGRYIADRYCLQFGQGPEECTPFGHVVDRLAMAGVTRAIMILDACYSGAAVGLKETNVELSLFAGSSIPKGIAVLASSGARQASRELSDGSASVFTKIFCEGLETGLGHQPTTDGLIGVSDMAAYIKARLESDAQFEQYRQRPVFSIHGADRDIWLAKNKSGDVRWKAPSASEVITNIQELELLYERTRPGRLPCQNIELDELDWDLIQYYADKRDPGLFSSTNRDLLLARLRMYSEIPVLGRLVPHRATVLCFGLRPDTFLPSALAVFVDETMGAEAFERIEVRGPLTRQLEELIRLVRSRLHTISTVGDDGLRREQPELDIRLLRELVSNAIFHRDYEQSGRVDVRITPEWVEIRSPGDLPLPWEEMLKQKDVVSRPVNLEIAYYQSCLPAFEGLGLGFRRIRAYLDKHGDESILCDKMEPGPTIRVRIRRPDLRASPAGKRFRHLPSERIYELHAATVALGLDQRLLLGGLDPALVATLPDMPGGTQAERLLDTLHRLNAMPRQEDGTFPFETWLRNALSVSGDDIFADVLAEFVSDEARVLRATEVRAQTRPPEDPHAARIRALSVERARLASEGKPTEEIIAEILALKRELRAGTDFAPHDVLSGGRFELLELMGRGGIGAVWKAFDEASQRFVAVKFLHPEHGPTVLARFRRGARCMARLDHPNIVRVVQTEGVEERGGKPRWFFAMEYMPGGTLKSAVLDGRWTVSEALGRVLQAGAGLQHAHVRGLIHRDVTPDNILLTADGTAKLTDFDLVRADDTTGLTGTGQVLGKFLYLAPELFDGDKDASVRSDVYALGMTVAFALYGKTLPRQALSHREHFLDALKCADPLKAVLRRATAEEPQERYASVAELCIDVEQALESPQHFPSEGKPTSESSIVLSAGDAPGSSVS